LAFTPFTQTKIVIDNPMGRKLNKYGAPCVVTDTSVDWVHMNIRFRHGCPPVKEAFQTKEPFKALGWDVKPGCPTETVYAWWYADCPVSDDFMLSMETHKQPPLDFLHYLVGKYKVSIKYELNLPLARQPQVNTINP
jgi:hypothetical protein